MAFSLLFVLAALSAWVQDIQPGDFDANERVDSDDLFDFAYYYGLRAGDPLFETEGYRADFDSSGRVDELDLVEFSGRWHRD